VLTHDGVGLVASQLCTLTLTNDELFVILHVPIHLEHPNPTPPVSVTTLTDELKRLTLLDPFVIQDPSVTTAGY
jgi:hypothetical protein